MVSQANKAERKLFLIKIYTNLLQMENAIRNIVQNNNLRLQLSILAKYSPYASNNKNGLNARIKAIKLLPDTRIQVGYFNSPEIGKLFIAGHLKDTFLHKINDKSLASLSAGLYGIFRAIGIELEDTDRYIKELQNGNFLLILRGKEESLTAVESVL